MVNQGTLKLFCTLKNKRSFFIRMAIFIKIYKTYCGGLLSVATSSRNRRYLVWKLPSLAMCEIFCSLPHPTGCGSWFKVLKPPSIMSQRPSLEHFQLHLGIIGAPLHHIRQKIFGPASIQPLWRSKPWCR